MTNKKHKYKVFSLGGKELDIKKCIDNGIILCFSNQYFSNDKQQCIDCPNQCSRCSYESVRKDLCTKCNNHKNYFSIYFSDDYLFLTCVNETKKPTNLFLNRNQLRYEPCYDTCEECFNFGNNKVNNCTSCIHGYIKREDYPNNCVLDCKYYYYYNNYSQYRCTEFNTCPLGMYIIRDKKKCVYKCNEVPYIHEFKGECFKSCPEVVSYDNKCSCKYNCNLKLEQLNNHINELTKQDSKFINELVKRYAFEIKNIDCNYIYNYVNSDYSLIIYKNEECLNSLIIDNKINVTRMNLKPCYDKLKTQHSFSENKIIILLMDINRERQTPYSYFSFYHPDTGDLLDSTICSDIKIEKQINILSLGMDNKEEKTYLYYYKE